MSSEIESAFGNFCRTCMAQDNEADTEFQSIFDAILNTEKPISDLLKILMGCNLIGKPLPNRMCGKCVQRIGDVHEFQQMCLRTQSKFLQMVEERKFSILSLESPSDINEEESDPLEECLVENNMENDTEDETAEHNNHIESSFSSEGETKGSDDDEMIMEDAFICHICQRIFEKARGLREHINRHHTEKKEKKHECEICHRTFHKDRGLREHRNREHPSESALVCNTCGKSYRSLGTFKKHKQTHKSDGERNDQDKEIESDENLEEFLKKKKESRKPKKIHTCEFCQKTYLQVSHLKVHRRIHTGERPFLCKECGKSFRCKTTLDFHERVHAGIMQYECPSCPKTFSTNSYLIKHKRVHSDIKPHVCEVCGASFKFPRDLRTHKLYHGERSVKCEQCDKLFFTWAAMRNHMLTHTGEKPYKCKFCDRAFNQSGWMMQHMRTHVGKNVYRCELCPMGFPLHKEMRKHFASHKNDDEATRQKNLEALAEYERNLSQLIKTEKEIDD